MDGRDPSGLAHCGASVVIGALNTTADAPAGYNAECDHRGGGGFSYGPGASDNFLSGSRGYGGLSFGDALSAGIGFIPGFGDAYDLFSAGIAYDVLAQEHLGPAERGLYLAGAALPFASGGSLRVGRELVGDFITNRNRWEKVGSFIEPAISKRARGGVSIQDIFENPAGDRMIEHTVFDRLGNPFDGPHPRPFYKPRIGVDR